MPKKTLPKEIDHECDTHNFFWHFLLGHETGSQTNSIKVVNLTCKYLEVKNYGLRKIVRSVYPFCFACTQDLVNPHGIPSKYKVLGLSTLDHLTCCYIYPCALMQTFKCK